MPSTSEPRQPAATATSYVPPTMIRVGFAIPRTWHSALTQAADVQQISMADLCRIIIRGFLRERYSAEEQRALGVS